jgi:hypothetical protein
MMTQRRKPYLQDLRDWVLAADDLPAREGREGGCLPHHYDDRNAGEGWQTVRARCGRTDFLGRTTRWLPSERHFGKPQGKRSDIGDVGILV